MFVKTLCLRATLSETGTPENELIKKPVKLPLSLPLVECAGDAAAVHFRGMHSVLPC